ncbi:MAG: hypothetical protein AMJ53_07215 [Gammaproteobacteria bacterium SG8_11]|nr:MAG: hypothetical protein AMJ53_07215 [Gammaproteobacteria bacterium SG8_11]
MNDYIIFAIEILTCLGISGAVVYVLNPLLIELLSNGCRTANRSLFWVRFADIMLMISPLMLVIFFTHTGEPDAPNTLIIFKDTLFRSLLGEFIGLIFMGQVIWSFVSNPNALSPSTASDNGSES